HAGQASRHIMRMELNNCILAVLLAFCSPCFAQTESRETRELKMADQALISSLVVSHSTAGQSLCREDKLACVGPDKQELALALIGARNTKASREALARLLIYKLDGAVGEDYGCYILQSAGPMKRALASIDAQALSNSCRLRVGQLSARLRDVLLHFDTESVCSAPDEITNKAKQFQDSIQRGKKCRCEDF